MFSTYIRDLTRISAIADKPRDAFRGQLRKVSKHGTIPYVRYGFLVCYSNFVFETSDFINAVTLKTGLGVGEGR